jgi:hypothetical protein
VFTSYFASTKRQNNLCTGKLGLGCKSALSYVNSFGVISYYNGKASKYLVQLSKEGIPEIHGDEPEDTDQPNGVKITIYVDPASCGEFSNAAAKIYPYFDIKPRFVNCSFEIPKLEYVISGETDGVKWGFNPKADEGHIVMGGIAYPVLDDKDTSFTYSKAKAASGLDLYVKNDAFHPTPSRESLHWTDSDETNLKELISAVERSIHDAMLCECEKGTGYERVRYLKRLMPSRIADRSPALKRYGWSFNQSDDSRYDKRKSVWFYATVSDGCIFRLINEATVRVARSKHDSKTGCSKMALVDAPQSGVMRGVGSACVPLNDEPVRVLFRDAIGLTHVRQSLKEWTIVIGTHRTDKRLFDQIENDLKSIAEAQRFPLEISRLSGLLGQAEKVKKPRSNTPKKLLQGLFKEVTVGYVRKYVPVTSLAGFTHYVEFCSDGRDKASPLPEMKGAEWKLLKNTFLKGEVNPVFAKPGAVSNVQHLPNLAEELKASIRDRFKDDIEVLSRQLRALGSHCFADNDSALGILLRDVLSTNNWFPLYLNVRQPTIRRICKALVSYRCHGLSTQQEISNRYGYSGTSVCGLIFVSDGTRELLRAADFCPFINDAFWAYVFQDTLQKLQAEANELKQEYPYLFYRRDELLYNAIINKPLT